MGTLGYKGCSKICTVVAVKFVLVANFVLFVYKADRSSHLDHNLIANSDIARISQGVMWVAKTVGVWGYSLGLLMI